MDKQPSGKRTYILDTNVLIYDPNALFVFQEHDLVLPIVCVEEIDKFKRELTERGRAARAISRQLDSMRASGRLSEGVPLPGGGRLRVELGKPEDAAPLFGGASASNDNLILRMALRLQQESPERRISFVSRDVNVRLKADALGMQVEDYEHAHLELDESYTGVVERDVAQETVDEAWRTGAVPESGEGLAPNQFVILRNEMRPDHSVQTRYDPTRKQLSLVVKPKEGCWGIFARNREQIFAMDLLLDDRIPVVTIDGMAGTGKTLLAMACGLRRVVDDKRYRRLVVARPIFPMGKDLGYLPGSVDEKLNPWMKPIFDALELIVSGEDADEEPGGKGDGKGGKAHDRQRRHGASYQALIDQKLVEIEPLTYIRGRSMPKQFLIIDEAQNLTPHEVKTILTRAGEGTKVVLTGDRYQIDNPYVDATSNGLTYVAEHFRLSPMAGHVTLRKGERSALAELAAKLL